MLLSLFVPGLGAIYGGEVFWGIFLIAAWLVSWPLLAFAVGIITLPLTWIVGIISGYQAPQKWNRKHGIIS